jgi:glycosyltransferase involved in cell wall biosynthesis
VNFNKDVRLGGLAAKFAGSIPVVWSVGLDITSDSWANRQLTPHLIDSVIVPSESLKRQITARGYIGGEMVSVIPIGIPDDPRAVRSSESAQALRSELNLPPDVSIAVTVARFVDQKGHTILIDALPEIVARIPDMRFLFLGDGPLAPVIRSRAAALGVTDYLIFGGMRDDIVPAVAGSDMMIHPSVEEPFGIALLEGMRGGLPIVASAVGGIPEVAGGSEGMILVEPRNPQALASAVIATLTDPNRAAVMGQKNRQRFEEYFTTRIMIDRVENVFVRITEMAPHHG